MADFNSIIQEINTNLPDNNEQLITPEILRNTLIDFVNEVEDSDGDLETAIQNKQDTLTFDNTPTENSDNPVTSDGVYDALQQKADKVANATSGNFASFDNDGNLIDSGYNEDSFTGAINITYADLKALRDSGNLITGTWYRIIDYQCTTSQENTQSAGNQFDIIVCADDASHLNENARAAHHEGDTYFANCKLEAWELKYCLDNDINRFAWALGNSSSGNGGAKGAKEYVPEYIFSDEIASMLDKAELSTILVFQGIETITIEKEDVKCYIYGTSVQANACNEFVNFFIKEYPSEKTDILGIDSKGNINKISLIENVSKSTQPINGTKVIVKSLQTEKISKILRKYDIDTELEFNGRIVKYKGQNCYSYGSSAQYDAISEAYVGKIVSNIVVTDGVSPVAPNKASEPGTEIVILDNEDNVINNEPIYTISEETIVAGGTGVIYYMKDEWNNECPYDFKNIMFKRFAIAKCLECPSLEVKSHDNAFGYYYGAIDLSGINVLNGAKYGEDSGWFYTFALKDLASNEWYDYTVVAHLGLKDDEDLKVACHDNHIIEGTDEYYSGNGELARVLNNVVFFNCYGDLSDTSFSEDYSYCNGNRFFGKCQSNTFGNYCQNNLFGNNCQLNTFGDGCKGNTFGNDCVQNVFGNECVNNSFGNHCQNNSFKNVCANNSFCNLFYNNSFGNDCYDNSFGNNFFNNTVGNSCKKNSFGNGCISNTFGNSCQNSSFGNNFGGNLLGNYCQDITVFDDVQNCSVTGGGSRAPVKNAQILNGTAGVSTQNKLTITFESNQSKTQVACLNSQGQLVIYYAGDLAMKTSVVTLAGASVTQELADNTIYQGSTLSQLTITIPSGVTPDYISQINFASGSTATTLTAPNTIVWYGDDIVNDVFVPVADKQYVVMFYYDGTNVRSIVQSH